MLWLLLAALALPVVLLLVRPLIAARQHRAAGLLGVVLVAGAGGLYAAQGAPDLPGQGLSHRLDALAAKDPQTLTPPEILFILEQRVRRRPGDAEAWRHLGTMRLAAGRFDDAGDAFSRALRHGGADADVLVRLAEARIRGAGGIVTPPARAAIDDALSLDPDLPQARLFSAMAAEQAGDEAAAREIYAALAETAPSPLGGVARLRLQALDAPAGPDARAVAAASDMAPGDRQAMIEGMVAGLDARLREAPDDLQGWLRLIRSYGVLGRTEERAAAVERARAAFAEDEDALSAIAAAEADAAGR